MMTFYGFGFHENLNPLWRVRTWALERLISFNCASGDVRWAILLLALRISSALWVSGQRRVVRWLRGRAGRRAWLAADIADADRMVAAGGS
jgi:hypothetical protein